MKITVVPPRTVREFISEFRGLSGSAKQKGVLEEVGAARQSLPEFFGNGDQVNYDQIERLLIAMQFYSKVVKPDALGLIGKDHLAAQFQAAGSEEATFKYSRSFGDTHGIPDVVESAFGWCPDSTSGRRIITGVNWSPAIGNPFRRIGNESLDNNPVRAEIRVGGADRICPPSRPTQARLHRPR
jgi:hypothetical protein